MPAHAVVSIAIRVDEPPHQRFVPDDVFAPRKPRHLHVAIFENIHFDTLPDQGEREKDGVIAKAADREMDRCSFEVAQKIVKGMAHDSRLGS